MWGRGSADSKVAVAIFCHLATRLAASTEQLHGSLVLLFDLDEHTGRFGGAKRYFEGPDAPCNSFAGPPHPRADASKCDPRIADQDKLTCWLQQAIREGRTGGQWDGDFPRYIWHRSEGVPYEARLVNRELGQYKGYPLAQDEWPETLDGQTWTE